jgi:hypothetical protein
MSYEMDRQLEGTVEADDLYHIAGQAVFQKWRWPCLHCPSKGIAVDEQANDDVVHLGRFRNNWLRVLLSGATS